ncbi:siderophore ABC transporter substrate-binding protein [Paenibacillus sp. GSMTC-2017]|uniref:siderophore ABC transporter substrate-binding protein n=1 Tax=Paenibacillus sp. GSMTC-2017 TaxID=2794350 RepID=UPI0018D7C04E|nr:siderophore ABC transporter substrate-binding protein [Paenibacillus sp. GSMTC-2017]MBH5320171.1 siderophore ABC transporter substrate-binding protein [Paenibacillus sp. GSMTC-2017]
MKKTFSIAAMILVFAMVLAACGGNNAKNSGAGNATPKASETPAATEVVVKHQLGETKVKVNPSKVVVFDFGTLDTLDKLGVEVAAVPQKNVPAYLAKYKDTKYINAGGLKEPDFETIDGISPELIIISGRQSAHYDALSEIAPTIFMGVDDANYMTSFANNVNTLAEIFGKQAEAKVALAEVEASVKAVNEKATAAGKKGLIILSNEGKISAYGPGSRFGIIHDVLGVTPVDATIKIDSHGNGVTFEYVAEKNPDYLFVIDRNAAMATESTAKETIENDLVKNTNAFKNGKIAYLDPQYWYLSGGGLVSVAAMVAEIDAAIK